MVYEFRAGRQKVAGRSISTPVGGKDAQVVGERLNWLRDTEGKLTPNIVLVDATPEDAPLHGYFEWHDEVAAERWRLHQAGDLIRAVVTVERSPTNEEIVTRAFISVDSGADSRYEPLATVLNDTALYAQVCRRALGELETFQERYSQFTSLADIGSKARSAVQMELENAISEAVAG